MPFRLLRSGLVLLALWLTACDTVEPEPPQVASVTLSESELTLTVGETASLTATVKDAGGQVVSRTVQWQSTNGTVASVDASGLVRALALGETRIIASVEGQRDTVFVQVQPEGDVTYFNVATVEPCEDAKMQPFRLAAETEHALVYVDVENPTSNFTDDDYRQLAESFDAVAWPVATSVFGMPSDLDDNGKIAILVTRAVNEMTPPGANWYVGGFFWLRDLFPRQDTDIFEGCAGSNEAELFYVLAPDPSGMVNGNPRSENLLRTTLHGTLIHELQHLINASRRYHVHQVYELEDIWMEEGLSHISEELAFYAATGLSPRANLTFADVTASETTAALMERYFASNLSRFKQHLLDPTASSPYDNDDDLATRGAAWHFLRYAADRKGGSEQALWHQLVNSPTYGFDNLKAVFGPEVMTYFHDWAVSLYADDEIPGIDAAFQTLSWNYRSMAPAMQNGTYALQTVTLTNGIQHAQQVRAGSAAYARFGVATGTTARLRLTSGGLGPSDSCETEAEPIALAVGQAYMPPQHGPTVLCIAGGDTGSEYVLIPFNSSTAQDASVGVEITGTGIAPLAVAPPAQAGPEWQGRLTLSHHLSHDRAWEHAHRLRERREMARYLRRPPPTRRTRSEQSASLLTFTLVRTR